MASLASTQSTGLKRKQKLGILTDLIQWEENVTHFNESKYRFYYSPDVPFSRSDPRWVGAWWLGFVIFGSAAILLSGPLFMFPRKMLINSRNSYRQRMARQQQQSVDKRMTAAEQIRSMYSKSRASKIVAIAVRAMNNIELKEKICEIPDVHWIICW